MIEAVIFGRVILMVFPAAAVNVSFGLVWKSPSPAGLTFSLIRFSAPAASSPIDQFRAVGVTSARGLAAQVAGPDGNSSSTFTPVTGCGPAFFTTIS